MAINIDHYSVALLKECMYCSERASRKLRVEMRIDGFSIGSRMYWNMYKYWSNMHDMYWNEYMERFSISKNKEK